MGQIRNVIMIVAITAAMAIATVVFTYLFDSIPKVPENDVAKFLAGFAVTNYEPRL